MRSEHSVHTCYCNLYRCSGGSATSAAVCVKCAASIGQGYFLPVHSPNLVLPDRQCICRIPTQPTHVRRRICKQERWSPSSLQPLCDFLSLSFCLPASSIAIYSAARARLLSVRSCTVLMIATVTVLAPFSETRAAYLSTCHFRSDAVCGTNHKYIRLTAKTLFGLHASCQKGSHQTPHWLGGMI